jgi:hypothetical protein
MKRKATPWEILGVDPDTPLDQVRTRYTELVKRHPPDRDPETFERIRDAWQAVRDPRAAARERLLGPEPLNGIGDLMEALRPRRRPVGAAAWLQAMREMTR